LKNLSGRKQIPTLPRIVAACALILFMLPALSGCRIGYVAHAAWGQAMLLANSEPVEKAEKSGALDAAQIERTRDIQDIKRFAEDELGIKRTDNYSTIHLKPLQDPIHALSAAPKDELRLKTWWFPVIGRMPYLGFFDLKRAEEEKAKLVDQGYDVVLRSAAAYSTLGWFTDPITMNMMEWPLRAVAETIIHELTHVTLYVKGQTAFNEGFAQFVGMTGAVRYLSARVGPGDRQTILAERLIDDERVFSSFLDMALLSLELIYQSPVGYDEKLVLRQAAYDDLMENYRTVKEQYKTNRYNAFGAEPLNNARLLSYGLYHRNFGLFERVYKAHDKDLRKFIAFFVELHKESDKDMLEATKEWLNNRDNMKVRPFSTQIAIKRGQLCRS